MHDPSVLPAKAMTFAVDRMRQTLARLTLLVCTLLSITQSLQIPVSDGNHLGGSNTQNGRQLLTQGGEEGVPGLDQASFVTKSVFIGTHPPSAPLKHERWAATKSGDVGEDALNEVRSALDVMQTTWFSLSAGDWPTAIDWTGAVIHTHLMATLLSMSRWLHAASAKQGNRAVEASDQVRLSSIGTGHSVCKNENEQAFNEINRNFVQSLAYYYGQDATGLRHQAYDDRLWVVLQWLASTKFVTTHSELHFQDEGVQWFGTQFVEAYAHRARVFYALAHRGWDTRLCGGGMLWNPALGPYKNAITNQLFIAASVAMFLDYPGDNSTSPILDLQSHRPRHNQTLDGFYLDAAIEGYDWLKNSHMTNDKGLYVDGFHITDWGKNGSEGTRKCDARSEEVFTYNQAVVLSGLRGLWEATGNTSYLEDGHALVRNAISATAWSFDEQKPLPSNDWAGLGRHGVIEENCDSHGNCTRDSCSFKGIFFHHLTTFCEELPRRARFPGRSYGASEDLALLHLQHCREYAIWVEHNARAAMSTRDRFGRFGTWWGWKAGVEEGREGGELFDEDKEDPNDRGRGRSVEVQGGGLAVLRAWLEFGKLG